MNEHKWTPGPWVLEVLSPEESQMGKDGEWNISAPSNGFMFGNTPYYPYVSENIYDAHLIAAAHDLYEALEEAVAQHGHALVNLNQARTALAKARGE